MPSSLKFQEEAQLEQFKSVMQISAMALKSAMLINGGAAISLLTFLGNSQEHPGMSFFTCALKFYIAGVTLSALATGFSYLAQFRYLHEMKYPSVKSLGKHITRLTIATVLASYLVFIGGGLQASKGFEQGFNKQLQPTANAPAE
ncbi:hypothetical protein ACLD02_00785 [Alloalcanivorax sp. C16-2]|uniref:hypothetical protein n=1 Tax=Alloalcanivorax sp. C16-2 TaxID=3390052 RepID=UPI003970880E